MPPQIIGHTLRSHVLPNGTYIFWLEDNAGNIVADHWMNYKPGEQEMSSIVLQLQQEAVHTQSNPSHVRTRSRRIGELIREGYPVAQAAAIAYREYGENTTMHSNPPAKMPQAFAYQDAEAILARTRHGKLGANTVIEREHDGDIVVRLYNTEIIRYAPDDSITLNSGGHRTTTTKGRINSFLSPYIRVHQEAGNWYIQTRKHSDVGFFDGITIFPDGGVSHEQQRTQRNPSHKKENFYNDTASIQWVRTTHLVDTPAEDEDFRSFVLVGSEDSPDEIRLYQKKQPLVTDRYYCLKFKDGEFWYGELKK